MKGLFTVKQLALLAVLFFKDDEANFGEYEAVATNAKKFIALGDPYTDESLLVFIEKTSEEFKGKLGEKENLKYFLAKIVVL